MENFPLELWRQIVRFIRGGSIRFKRDENGILQEIVGTGFNNEVISHTHCMCNSASMGIDDDGVTFCDIHLNIPIDNLWMFSIDLTEFDYNTRQIDRSHLNFKIRMNQNGDLIQIRESDELVYDTEFTADGKLKREITRNHIKDWEYENGIRTVKTSKGNELLSIYSFEQCSTDISNENECEKEYEYDDSHKILKRISVIVNNDMEENLIDLLPDGVRRCYFTHTGKLLADICLPNDPSISDTLVDINKISDIPEKLHTVNLTVVDNVTKSMRIIEKRGGDTLIDQVASYRDGKLIKVYNFPNSKFDSVLIDVFKGI